MPRTRKKPVDIGDNDSWSAPDEPRRKSKARPPARGPKPVRAWRVYSRTNRDQTLEIVINGGDASFYRDKGFRVEEVEVAPASSGRWVSNEAIEKFERWYTQESAKGTSASLQAIVAADVVMNLLGLARGARKGEG